MEFSAGEQRLLTLGDFQTCRSWKMWNFFGDFTGVVGVVHSNKRIGVSPRRYETIGPVRLTFAYGSIATLYLFGVSLSTLARIYRRTCCRSARAGDSAQVAGIGANFRSTRVARARDYAA